MKEIKELIKLKDGYIENIETDEDYTPGCETCDYGSRYVNEFTVILSKGKVEVRISQMYTYALSEGYLMKLFISNIDTIKEMTEDEFIEWLRQEIKEIADEECCDFYVDVYGRK